MSYPSQLVNVLVVATGFKDSSMSVRLRQDHDWTGNLFGFVLFNALNTNMYKTWEGTITLLKSHYYSDTHDYKQQYSSFISLWSTQSLLATAFKVAQSSASSIIPVSARGKTKSPFDAELFSVIWLYCSKGLPETTACIIWSTKHSASLLFVIIGRWGREKEVTNLQNSKVVK